LIRCALHIYPGYEQPGAALAQALGCPTYPLHIHIFPDGESLIRTEGRAKTALLYASLDRPNDKLINLIFAAEALRENGAERIVLVCPYLGYMRQDKAFHIGEAVSQPIMAGLLSQYFDRIITVDPHLHRVSSLNAVFPNIEADALSATGLIASAIRGDTDLNDGILIGPDSESAQWVGAIAKITGQGMLVAQKMRSGDREVKISFPAIEGVSGRPAIIIDDMISSGTTARHCAALLVEAGASRVELIAVHALCDEADLLRLSVAGIEHVRSCDSVPHDTNAIILAPLLAAALTKEL